MVAGLVVLTIRRTATIRGAAGEIRAPETAEEARPIELPVAEYVSGRARRGHILTCFDTQREALIVGPVDADELTHLVRGLETLGHVAIGSVLIIAAIIDVVAGFECQRLSPNRVH